MEELSDSESSGEQMIIEMLIENDDDEIISQIRKPATNIIKRIRTNHYWNDIYPILDARTYNHYYRKTRESILKLRDLIYSYESNMYNDVLFLEKVLCMTVEYLASRSTLLAIGTKYNFSDGKTHEHTTNILTILATTFHDSMVFWPSQIEKQAIANRFNSHKHMPMCIGVIDGTLVRTFGFYDKRQEMNTRKCHYGFNVLLICDDRGMVRQDWVDQAGSEADSTILRESTWYSDIHMHVSNTHTPLRPFYIISDKGIQGYTGIVTPFMEVGHVLDHRHLYFNAKLQGARAIIERVNGVLKSRYQAVGDGLRVSESKAEDMISSAIALHNFDILNGDLCLFNDEFNVNLMQIMNTTPTDISDANLPIISTRSWLFEYMTRHML